MFRTAALTLMLAFAGPAFAQSTSGGTTTASTSTPAEMRAFADSAVEQITKAAAEVDKLTENARKDSEGSGVLDCLTPRNVSMQALVQVATIAREKMIQALSVQDRERADHEFRKIEVSLNRANQIKQEANNCIGGEGGRGDDDVKVTGDQDGDDDTEDRDGFDDEDIGFDPPSITQFESQ